MNWDEGVRSCRNLLDPVDEILQELSEHDAEQIESADVDELTDEDEASDDTTGEATVQDVPGTSELHIDSKIPPKISCSYGKPVEESCLNNDSKAASTGSASSDMAHCDDKVMRKSKTKKRRLCDSEPSWKYKVPEYSKNKPREKTYENNLKKMKENVSKLTPLEIFAIIRSPDVYDHIIKESVRYATVTKNKGNVILSVEEIKSFFGYHKLPSERHFWSNDEDLDVPIVKAAMSRNSYQNIKSFLHFCDNAYANENKHDKGFKVINLISMLQSSFMQFGLFEECIAVDEMMVKYHGHL
ncbi:piggyBac transposable element-derived protein 2-like [Macrobrachium rosenbergii]|uniref:piggyBac transposable element-derived protein 2-like n=1 Tax=Macrobrachium rosenbergii TaxID=79674 RepID=UPI0034D5508E